MKILPNRRRPYIGMKFKWMDNFDKDQIFTIERFGYIERNIPVWWHSKNQYFRDESLELFIKTNRLIYIETKYI